MARSVAVELDAPGTVYALLGATNSGKTHVAIERMLRHRTGMIGLPLRLLAREVYDRVVAAKGADQVALVTGEEKRIPPLARYWVCTVESMPLDRPVAFLAVDEIQLAADPWRGHTFTDRLLHARGVVETWFLGSDTIEDRLLELVPEARVRSQPRQSKLSYSGRRKLEALPPRTAVVAYSVQRVYELAERLRGRHGGAAVVLGALSPRTRNAQVALFQSGEVQHLVATDAIGMGLNLDIHHVALAGLHKFDGRSRRPLRADELAQVVGRAGRWRRDGTFGETAGVDDLEPDTTSRIIQHRFEPVTDLMWRNPHLVFDTPAALVASLEQSPNHPRLVLRRGADDARALAALLGRPEVMSRAVGSARVKLLWDVCGVPDFGKVAPEQHARLLQALYTQLIDHDGTLPDAWMEAQVARLERTDGDIATLTARIAAVRIWTFVSHRRGWTHGASAWRDRTRGLEDRISDALHERLTARFVDRRARVWRGADGMSAQPQVGPDGLVQQGGEVVGTLHGFTFRLHGEAPASAVAAKAVRAAMRPLVRGRLERLLDEPDEALALVGDAIHWNGAAIARVWAGDHWLRPRVKPLRVDWLDGAERGSLARRVDRWVAASIEALTADAEALDVRAPAARAVQHALAQGGGAIRRSALAHALGDLSRGARAALRRQGVTIGRQWVVLPVAYTRVRDRGAWWSVARDAALPVPEDGGWRPFRAGWTTAQAEALGFERVDGWLVRADTLEGVCGADLPIPDRIDPEAIAAVRRRFGAGGERPRRRR